MCVLSSLPLISASTPLPFSSLQRISHFKQTAFLGAFLSFSCPPLRALPLFQWAGPALQGCAPSSANLTTKTGSVATRGPEWPRRRPRRRREATLRCPWEPRSASASSAANNPNYSAACTPSLASTGPTPPAREVVLGPRAEPPVPGTSPPTPDPRPAAGEDAAAPALPGSARPRPRM